MNTIQKMTTIFLMLLIASAAIAQTTTPGLMEPALPAKSCPTQVVYLKGHQDNFATSDGPEKTTPSPQLTSYLAGLHPGMYDVDQPNFNFGDSIPICPCETCSATLEIRVRVVSARDAYANDGFAVGVAPFSGGQKLAGGAIWKPGEFGPKTITVPLDPAALSRLLCGTKSPWLDIYVEDDTEVDWIKLTLTRP